jgi:hypothetical protein
MILKCLFKYKILRTTPYKINAYFLPIYENPCGFSSCDLFAKLVAQPRNETIAKHVVKHLRNEFS